MAGFVTCSLSSAQDDSGSDVEMQSLDEVERALEAKLDAIRAKKEQKLRAREAKLQEAKLQEEAEKKLLEEQRIERFEKLLGFLRSHERTKFTKRLLSEPTFLDALQAIIKDEHTTQHLIALSGPLMGWLVGDAAQWQSIAKHLLGGNDDASALESTDTSDMSINLAEAIGTDDQKEVEAHAEDTIIVNSNTGNHDVDMEDVEGLNDPAKQLEKATVEVEKEQSTESMQPPLKRVKLTVIEEAGEPEPSTPTKPLRPLMASSATPTSGSKAYQFARADTVSTGASSPVPMPKSSTATPSKEKSDAKAPTPKKLQAPLLNFERGLTDANARGEDVLSKLNCQNCAEYPKPAKLTRCEHIYCDRCLATIRKEAVKDNEEASCVACTNLLRRTHAVPKEIIDGWINKFSANDETASEDEANLRG